jgi:hypothetical protein
VIRRADGSRFKIVPERSESSPLDLPPLSISLRPGELRQALEEAREASIRGRID